MLRQTVAKPPLLTLRLYKKTAETSIQPIGKRPFKMPYSVERAASLTGIPKAKTATSRARIRVQTAARWPESFLVINRKNRARMGTDAAPAESAS
jgi:hypothetical protein